MNKTDIFIELVRLAEQAGDVTYASLTNTTCVTEATMKNGNKVIVTMTLKEDKKNV